MLLAGAITIGLPGCSGTTEAQLPRDAMSGTITVFAAASLTTTFTSLADEFERSHPGATVRLTFAGSSDLATQILEGAPADVFASADEANMARLQDAELVASPVPFATNVLEIAVPPANPAGITTLADLAAPDVKLVVCAPDVPCGAATVTVADAAGIRLSPVSEELSVTDVLGKVTSGEADAGLVYVTDVLAAEDAVDGIPFPESSQAVTTYPIAAVTESSATVLVNSFVAFIAGETAQSVLADAGFGPPPAP